MTTLDKPCIACHQAIHVAATKCQHCHQTQNLLGKLQNNRSAQGVAGLAIIAMIGGFGFHIYSTLTQVSTPPPSTVGPASLRVSQADQASPPRVSCFATLTNPGPRIVRNPSLQAEFFDAKGDRVDVHYQEHKVSIYPSVTMQSRVTGSANAAASDYASCKIGVINSQ